MIMKYNDSGNWSLWLENDEEKHKIEEILAQRACSQADNINNCVSRIFNEIFQTMGNGMYMSTRNIVFLEQTDYWDSDTSYTRYHRVIIKSGFQLPMPRQRYLQYERWTESIPAIYASLSQEEKTRYWQAVQNFIYSALGIQPIPEYYITFKSEAVPTDFNISFLDNGIIIANDEVYELKLSKINGKGKKSVVDSIRKQTETAYKVQVEALKAAYTERIKTLEKEIKDISVNSISTAVSAIKNLQSSGWFFDKDIIIYPYTITADKIQYRGIFFDIPKEYQVFHVDLLATKIDTVITNVVSFNAFHPNVNTSIDYPNIYDGKIYFNYNVCLGDLNGKPFINVLKGLPEMLKLVNLDSAFSSNATSQAQILFYYLYKKSKEGTIEQKEVWEAR